MEQGDYRILRADDSQTINRLDISGTVEPGMILKMSIVIRRSATFQDNKEECPRCHQINLNAAVSNNWIEWQVPYKFHTKMLADNGAPHSCKCSGKFQIAAADPNDGGSDKERDHLSGGDEGTEGGENDDKSEDGDEGSKEDITSAAACVIHPPFCEAMIKDG